MNFFLYGVGGDRSIYPTEKIIPLTTEQAQAWTEKNLDAETYLEHFKLNEQDTESFSLLDKMEYILDNGYSFTITPTKNAKKYELVLHELSSYDAVFGYDAVELMKFPAHQNLEYVYQEAVEFIRNKSKPSQK